jgi:hypothetical protein
VKRSCMSNTATDSAAEGNPLWHRSLQRLTYSASQMRSGVGQTGMEFRTMRATCLSVANYNTTLSSDSLETGTGSSNSLRSANESLRTDTR